MDSIRQAVLDCRSQSSNDDELINKLTLLINQEGPVVCQAIFHIFTSLEIQSDKAEKYWNDLLLHHQDISRKLGRNIDLIPAMSDFFSISQHPLGTTRLIKESDYAKVILETTHDNLTTLFNRYYFDEVLEQTVSSAKRYNTDISLLFLDIDNFKDVNDTYGHTFGDTTLQKVAAIIKEEKRDSDIAARYGGEEFVLLMPHTESMNAYILAERIRQKIEEILFETDGKTFSVTISGGLASYPQNAKNSSELLHNADSALYLAKGAGKNLISMYKQENRRYLRVKFKEPVKVKALGFDSSKTFSGTSKDICIGGILFESKAPFAIGSRIQVSIPIKDDSPLLLIGTVVRIEAFSVKRYDIGMTISFKEMEKIANNEIANFLKNNQSS